MKTGARDFDFLMGRWRVHNRRLRKRLVGSTEWDEFESTFVARPLAGGLGNEDEYRTDYAGGFTAMSFRFFDPATGKWAIYWADNRRGTLDPPVYGAFEGGTGRFEGTDTFEGRPILVRFLWSRVDTPAPRWEQAFSEDGGKTWETNWIMEMTRAEGGAVEHLGDFGVIEFRRYTIKPREREHFARYFDSYFPEAFEQLGAIAFGQFFEREKTSRFAWLRGYRNMDERAKASAAFYYGPVWKEHRAAVNGLILDSDDVLLLRPLAPERRVAVLHSVDPVRESGEARGVVVAQIFAVVPGGVEAFAREAEPAFAAYRASGAREAGVLATLEEPNNFPQHPVREDGPFLVWLGILEDDRALGTRFAPLARRFAESARAGGPLRGDPETVVLDPTSRSRLRWLGGTPLAAKG
jgi:NIPSNAP